MVDSNAFVLYRDTTFTYGAIIDVDYYLSETAASGPMWVDNAFIGSLSAFTGAATKVTAGGPCRAITGLRTPLSFPIGDCRLATFTVSLPSFGAFEFGPISVATQAVGGVIVGPL